MTGRLAAAASAIGIAIALAGCGLGAGHGTSAVTVTVTRGFGSRSVANVTSTNVPGSETVMRALERSFHVTTRYGGGFVQSINGLAGSSAHLDWFYYVNGLQAPVGAASTSVHKGDAIWWDLHDWTATDTVPAVVGSFPEPFVHGEGGKRFPAVIECGATATRACSRVSDELSRVGVNSSPQVIGAATGTDIATILVGPWSALRGTLVARVIDARPGVEWGLRAVHFVRRTRARAARSEGTRGAHARSGHRADRGQQRRGGRADLGRHRY